MELGSALHFLAYTYESLQRGDIGAACEELGDFSEEIYPTMEDGIFIQRGNLDAVMEAMEAALSGTKKCKYETAMGVIGYIYRTIAALEEHSAATDPDGVGGDGLNECQTCAMLLIDACRFLISSGTVEPAQGPTNTKFWPLVCSSSLDTAGDEVYIDDDEYPEDDHFFDPLPEPMIAPRPGCYVSEMNRVMGGAEVFHTQQLMMAVEAAENGDTDKLNLHLHMFWDNVSDDYIGFTMSQMDSNSKDVVELARRSIAARNKLALSGVGFTAIGQLVRHSDDVLYGRRAQLSADEFRLYLELLKFATDCLRTAGWLVEC